MNGTEWTEPGQGATVRDLCRAAHTVPLDSDFRHLAYRAVLSQMGRYDSDTTNLRLTGAPLTAEDLKKIAECK